MTRLKSITNEVINELATEDARVEKVWNSYREFQSEARSWQEVSELAYMESTEE